MKPDCPNCQKGSCYHITTDSPPRNGEVVFKIRQRVWEDAPDMFTWEGELEIDGEVYCEGTAPTFWGVHDILTEYIWEQTVKDDHPVFDHNWFKKDANDR